MANEGNPIYKSILPEQILDPTVQKRSRFIGIIPDDLLPLYDDDLLDTIDPDTMAKVPVDMMYEYEKRPSYFKNLGPFKLHYILQRRGLKKSKEHIQEILGHNNDPFDIQIDHGEQKEWTAKDSTILAMRPAPEVKARSLLNKKIVSAGKKKTRAPRGILEERTTIEINPADFGKELPVKGKKKIDLSSKLEAEELPFDRELFTASNKSYDVNEQGINEPVVAYNFRVELYNKFRTKYEDVNADVLSRVRTNSIMLGCEYQDSVNKMLGRISKTF